MPPRCMKPVWNNAMVLMGNGSRKPLGEIRVGDVVITNKGRPRRVLASADKGLLECVEIKTHSGRSVIASLDHPFLTPDGWIEAGKLQVGQSVATVPCPETVPTQADRCLEEFRMAGYFVGDGSCGPVGRGTGCAAVITTGDEEVAKDLAACAARLGFTVS